MGKGGKGVATFFAALFVCNIYIGVVGIITMALFVLLSKEYRSIHSFSNNAHCYFDSRLQ